MLPRHWVRKALSLALLKAGSSIEYAVVEFDKYGGDIFEGIADSYAFLADTLKG